MARALSPETTATAETAGETEAEPAAEPAAKVSEETDAEPAAEPAAKAERVATIAEFADTSQAGDTSQRTARIQAPMAQATGRLETEIKDKVNVATTPEKSSKVTAKASRLGLVVCVVHVTCQLVMHDSNGTSTKGWRP